MAQDRNNPIPETVEHVPGYPTSLIIYKAPFSRFYQTRVYLTKLVKRSTKTEVRSRAIDFAKTFYKELLLKSAQGLPLTESKANFEEIAQAVIEEDKGRVARGECRQSVVDDFEYMYEADLRSFFERDNVKSINSKRIDEYVAHLQKRGVSSQKPLHPTQKSSEEGSPVGHAG
jgi:hypothetical protein